MHLKSAHIRGFKRFSDLTVSGLSSEARLLVLAGPNGSGKSSFFDALKVWHWSKGVLGSAYDASYHQKIGTPALTTGWPNSSVFETYEEITGADPDQGKKLLYVRSAYRNEAEFVLNGLTQLPPQLDSVRVQRTIDNDVSVSINYQRLILETLGSVYDETLDESTPRREIRDRFIGTVRDSLKEIFPDLTLTGVSSDPITGGTFLFAKGSASAFPYKNLSAGEKAVFDLILDMTMAGRVYNNTVWCIDEPETHLNVRVQAKLLDQLLHLLPPNCQLVLASHSLGFMRRAWELAQQAPNEVQFLDFQDRDFDQPVVIEPTPASRDFWARTLEVAMGDLAALVAPEEVVLCEGRPVSAKGKSTKSEFDAKCYRTIFAAEFPNVDFISMGNSDEVKEDKIELGRAIQTISSGTKVRRLVDRDLLSDEEVAEHKAAGVNVLGRRHIESYLLDDETITAFVTDKGHPELVENMLGLKTSLLQASVARGNDPDDVKSIAAEWYAGCRKALALTGSGSGWQAFAVLGIAPVIKANMTVYAELKQSIFE